MEENDASLEQDEESPCCLGYTPSQKLVFVCVTSDINAEFN